MEESKTTDIRLHGVAPSIFLLVLEYLYTGTVGYEPHQAVRSLSLLNESCRWCIRMFHSFFISKRNTFRSQADLLRVADLLLLFDLRDDCAKYLNRHLSQDNCIALLQLADQFGLETLRDGCLECLIKSLPVCAHEGWIFYSLVTMPPVGLLVHLECTRAFVYASR